MIFKAVMGKKSSLFHYGLDHFVPNLSSIRESRLKVLLYPVKSILVRSEISKRDTIRPTLVKRQ